MTTTAVVQRRIVGAALRRYRQRLGLALDDAAQILECDRSKISRIETGQRGIRNPELLNLLTEYGADEEAQDLFAMIANPRRVAGWWRAYTDVLPGPDQDYCALEQGASQIMIFAAQQLPGLLQTGEYASAIAAATETMPAAKLERLADACRVRQENVLLASQPDVVVVISEAALQYAVGGNDVMCAQLSALANANIRFPGVAIHVLPFNDAAPTATGTGSFTILRYAQVDIGVACLPDISGGVFFEDRFDAAIVTRVFEQLKACALAPEASTQLIRHIRETYADAGLAADGLRL